MIANAVGKSVEVGFAALGVKNPKQAKTILIAGVSILVIGAIALAVRRRIKKRKESTYGAAEMEAELQELGVKSSNLTISNGDAVLIAQNLLAAMNRYGTDEKAIYENLERCQTKDDLNLVIQKFGSKPYNGTNLATTWFDRNYASTMKNLVGWLRAELTKREEAKVKEIFDRCGVTF